MVLSEPDLSVVQVSENSYEHLGLQPRQVLQKLIGSLFEGEQVSYLQEALQLEDLSAANPLRFSIRHEPERSFDGIVHRNGGGTLVLELEPHDIMEVEASPYAVHTLRGSLERLQSTTGVEALCEVAAEEVRRLTGFDRIMIYRLDAEWKGEVIAESKVRDTESYLYHRFPASDIPRQARELYATNWIRLIPTANYHPAPLVGDDSSEPLDMTFSVLRSVSPIHLEYLKNMNVDASMSVSIMQDGRLWGLIACHHRSPRYLLFVLRQDLQFLGQVLSSQIAVQEATKNYIYQTERTEISAKIVENVAGEHFMLGLTERSPNLLDYTEATGAAVLFDDQCATIGETPDEDGIKDLRHWLASREQNRDPVYWTDSLSSAYEPATAWKYAASGLLSLEVFPERGCYVLWFRPEVVRTLTWGGDPDKPATLSDTGRISPRKSFESWKKTVRMRSLPWTLQEIDAAYELHNVLTSVVAAQVERERADSTLRESEERHRATTETAADAILTLDQGGFIVGVNRAAEEVFGYGSEEMIGKSVGELMPETLGLLGHALLEQPDLTEGTLEGASKTQLPRRRIELLAMRKNREEIPLEVSFSGFTHGGRRMFTAFAQDISERKRAEELEHQAFHDSLTGLPNRALFMNRLQHALERAGRHRGSVGVMFLDLDGFKRVNDSLGHEAGDQLLVVVADRLQGCLRPEDTAARLGGDEFTVLLEELTGVQEAIQVAERIVERLKAPYDLGEHASQANLVVSVSSSIGIALGSAEARDPTELLRWADLAMYQAKTEGKARYRVFGIDTAK
jgi:diguanylate cyclase (GGDEF)-like protein/PAS domain S-box-containing protein